MRGTRGSLGWSPARLNLGRQWANPGKQDWRCGMNRTRRSRARVPAHRSQKRCRGVMTAGRWPWKSESAKECVTTHLPNFAALKKDGAEAGLACAALALAQDRARSKRARGWGRSLAVKRGGPAPGADLGGSSDNTSVTLVDRRGARFRVNRDGTRVSRS